MAEMSRSQFIQSIIKGLEGKDGNPPTSAQIIRAVVFLQKEYEKAHQLEHRPRPGWKCPDAEYEKDYGEPYKGPASPDGICVYYSDEDDSGRRYVRLKMGAQWVKHYQLPKDHNPKGESSDWCIFCGEPDERK